MLRSRLGSLPGLHANQWIRFEDSEGPGYAQPDVFLVFRDKIILFECKLTETLAGHSQLRGLYEPLLFFIYKRPIVKILVCKRLSRQIKWRTEVDDLPGSIASSAHTVLTWQWLP